MAERAGRDAEANAVDDADAFKPGDKGECGAGRICTGDRHRIRGVEGADQHAHHHFPGAEVPGFRDITDPIVSIGPGASAIAASMHLA